MKEINFPVDLKFKISTLSNDFEATDTSGNLLAYVRQKMFKLKADISVFADVEKKEQLYSIKADKFLDFSTGYLFENSAGEKLGRIVRKGWRSLWKASYEIIDQNDQLQYHLQEENPFIKVIDATVSEIPIIGMFTGYIFNPSYIITDSSGKQFVRVKKEPSFFGRKFKITKLEEFDTDDAERIILSCMMMVLLERRRG